MKEITVEATFKGQNGSLGYLTGVKYKLKFNQNIKGTISIVVVRPDEIIEPKMYDFGECLYESMSAFMANWRDITEIEHTKDKKEVVVNYIDLFNVFDEAFESPAKKLLFLKKASVFYQQEFAPEKIMDCFRNWSIKKQPNKKVTLTNNHSNGEWSSKIIIHDGGEYTFQSGTPISEKDYQWMYVPKTMSEFISDCLRHSDIELLFSKTSIKNIYG